MADGVAQILATSVRRFCEQYGFSKSTFYNLKKRGLAPKTIGVGARQIITNEARDEWVARMEALEAAKAEGGSR
jgi:predicted DNA-binding transcriptional regulator AlpA